MNFVQELQYPSDILQVRTDNDHYVSIEKLQTMSEKLEDFFRAMNLPVSVADKKFNNVAMVFTLVYKDVEGKAPKRFETKLAELKNLQKDLELCTCWPVEISGEGNTICLAVKCLGRRSVTLRDLFRSGEFLSSPSPLTVAGGIDVSGGNFVFDLEKLGSLLVVGVTGVGKSTFLNDIILSILAKATPEQAQFVLMDFKWVELQHFEGIPYMYYDYTIKQPALALEKLRELREISRKRADMLTALGVYSFTDYTKQREDLPHILIVIDEFIELYQKFLDQYPLKRANALWKEVLACLEEISEKTIQTGIHLVLVAQTPIAYEPDEKNDRNKEWDIIDTLRFVRNRACLVARSQQELKRIVKTTFTDRLLGSGDMYFYQGLEDPGRHIQTANVDPDDVDRVIRYIQQR